MRTTEIEMGREGYSASNTDGVGSLDVPMVTSAEVR